MTTIERGKRADRAANRRLRRKNKREKKRRGVNEELRYMGWTERERRKRRPAEKRKRSYDLRDAKRENGEYWEKREIGLRRK